MRLQLFNELFPHVRPCNGKSRRGIFIINGRIELNRIAQIGYEKGRHILFGIAFFESDLRMQR